MRINAIHIVNQSWLVDLMYQVFKPFLDKKMRSIIHFHGTKMDTLHTFIDPKHLPKKYGGECPDVPYEEWLLSLYGNKKIVEELRSAGYILEDDEIDTVHKQLELTQLRD